jgi:hypothetical protein
MGLYAEDMYSFGHDGKTAFTTLYRQPAWRHAAARLVSWASLHGDKLVHLLDDQVAKRLHARTCNNDCGVWELAAGGATEPGCVRLGWCADLDFWIYSLQHRNRVDVNRTEYYVNN